MELESIYGRIAGHRVTTDSRTIQPDDVFIALRGEHFNGNAFVKSALEAGAALAISDDAGFLETDGVIVVGNTLETLQQLAALHRRKLGIPILGITGTNGKTTTKELCCAVLRKKYRTVATRGNLNNHIGIPLTLLSMTEDTEFGIVEMGANHPGEIADLCTIADPDFAIVTNIGEAHIEGFGCRENIISTKTALYRHVQAKGGKLFVNADDPLLMELSAEAERFTYGNAGDTARGTIVQSIPFLVAELCAPHGHLYVQTGLVGGYNFPNVMAAICIGMHFGMDPLKIAEAIKEYEPDNMRSQLIRKDSNTIILDAYNANPSSMQAATDNFAQMRHDRKIVILGEMRELGPRSESAHRELFKSISDCDFVRIMLVGEPFKTCASGKNTEWFENTEALIERLKTEKPNNCLIFVKGSRFNRLERIVEYL